MLSALAFVVLAMLESSSSGVDWRRLIEASAKAITARPGPIQGEALGRFDTPLGEARAFKTDFNQGAFHRRYVILIEPKQAAGGPLTVMLTSDANVDEIARSKGDPPPIFVDLYTCNTHSTMAMLPREPTFEELRSIVVEKLQRPPSSSTESFSGRCGFGAYVLPGLGSAR
ncbi:MAG: hypothetical protein JWQ97_2959 [Phenylobacterium sp.]|nr:hypothetical protein [Phenylobacterium sp.]